MKKFLALLTAVVAAAVLLSFSVSAAGAFYSSTDGDNYAYDTPVGCKAFKVTFDLTLPHSGNPAEGEEGYTGLFPFIFIDKDKIDGNLDIPQFRITNNHLQAVVNAGSYNYATPNTGIVDFGGSNFNVSANETGSFSLELKDRVLTLTRTDGNAGTINFTYTEAYLDGSPLYLNFSNFNGSVFTFSNFAIVSTDYVDDSPETGSVLPVALVAAFASGCVLFAGKKKSR